MKILVHGATGAQGSPLVARLLAEGHQVTALSRRSEQSTTMTTVVADAADPEGLTRAYERQDGVFVHLPIGPASYQRSIADAVVAAVEATKPRRVVVSTSGQIVDEPLSPLSAAPDSPIRSLIDRLSASSASIAVAAPRLFLENLLLPVVADSVRAHGVLRYPLRANYPVSWTSHDDVAEVVAALLTVSELQGVIGVGQLPAVSGAELAGALAAWTGHPVVFQELSPEQFGELITPIFGADAARPVVGLYRTLGSTARNVIDGKTSAQSLLGLRPRDVPSWLSTIGF